MKLWMCVLKIVWLIQVWCECEVWLCVDYDESSMIMFRRQFHEWWWLNESLSHIYTQWVNEWMNEANANVIDKSLFEGFLNRTVMI